MTDGLLRVTKYSLKELWPLGLGVVGMLVLPPVGLQMLARFLGRLNSPSPVSLGWHFFFMAVSAFLLAVVCGTVLEQTKKMLPRIPVKTAEIVSALILSTLVVSVSVSLVATFIYRQLLYGEAMFRDGWPILGPTLFLSTMVVVLHWGFWNLQSLSLFRVLFWICFGDMTFFWFMSRYFDSQSSDIFEPWKQVTPLELITMSVVFVASWIGAIRSCDRVRCGATESSRTWEHMQTKVKTLQHQTIIAPRKRFESISSAFARLYWQDSCRSSVAISVGLGCLVFFLTFFSGNSTSREVIFLSIMAFFSCGVILILLLGFSLSPRESTQMKVYLAIVPLSDRDMAFVLTRTIVKLVLLLVGSILLFGLTGGSLLFWLFEGTAATQEKLNRLFGPEWNQNLVCSCAWVALAVWAMLANILALTWSPQRGSKELLAAMPTVVIVTAVISDYYPIWGVVFFLTNSALIWSATIIAYLRAYRANLIRTRALWLAGLFCLIVPAVYWNYWSTSEWPLKLLWSSLLMLAVTPFATIPLAVSWNRHR
ncbi:hypothetical protein [Gimesia maris]|uniref:hypothetical protein n=1 Tax=Gimesia maris TaxID=122 RepID=UPI0030DDA59B|tara:strand:- start:239708 stop:241321 length:1614 start_codon:yes stop_codon:yes gene_type:complete